MKTVFIVSILWFYVSCQQMTLDPRTEHCIPKTTSVHDRYNFSSVQIITGLSRYRLSVLGNYGPTPDNNAFYNTFLTCAWLEYGYYIKPDVIVYEKIQESLTDAFVKEVGDTGPSILLSKLQAKNFVANCKNVTGYTTGAIIVKIQNCIHDQIRYLGSL